MPVSLCQLEWPQESKVDLIQEFQWILKGYDAAQEEENQKKKHSPLLKDLGKSLLKYVRIIK
jgi:hypothetical protein